MVGEVALAQLAASNFRSRAGVEGDGVGGGLVPVLVDVDLAVVGPVRAVHPESWPGAADGLG